MTELLAFAVALVPFVAIVAPLVWLARSGREPSGMSDGGLEPRVFFVAASGRSAA